MSFEDDIRAVQARLAELQTKKTRAEIESDNARARATEAKSVLVDTYGITDKASMEARRAELEQDLADALTTVRAKIDEASA